MDSAAHTSPRTPVRSRRRHRTRIMGIGVGLIAAAHWCHPPIPDINFWHRPSGPAAMVTESIPQGGV